MRRRNHRWQASPNRPIVTIGDPAHISALDGWRGDVLVKLASSMRRFGVAPRELDDFERTARVAGLKVVGYSIHLPLAGEDLDRVAEVERWVTVLDNRRTAIDRPSDVWVSHLGPDAHAGLCARWPDRRFPIRLGTALWHGDKSMLHLTADVLDIHAVSAGTVAGYNGTRVIADGTLVIIGAGSAHGVTVLDDGRSPFHFQHRRLALLERPHMHTLDGVRSDRRAVSGSRRRRRRAAAADDGGGRRADLAGDVTARWSLAVGRVQTYRRP